MVRQAALLRSNDETSMSDSNFLRRSADQRPTAHRRTKSRVHKLAAFLRSRTFLGSLITTTALGLVVLHGFKEAGFVVDEITLGLLAFASLPFISSIVTSFKAGDVEISFRDLSVREQVFAFLDGIATKKQWTFYTPRLGEDAIGPAFAILTEDLLKNARAQIREQVRTWIASDDVNQRWFAAEIVGFHRLSELRRVIERAPETKDFNERWQPWELNCVWAASCMDDPPFRGLVDFLSKTNNLDNQAWILKSFDQMIEAGTSQAGLLAHAAATLAHRHSQLGIPPKTAEDMLEGLSHLKRALNARSVARA
jgi:hypothetical protein